MTFPYTPLLQKMEFNINSIWTDVTSYIRRVDRLVTITRGRASEAVDPEPTEVGFDLNNHDGRFSLRNPTGDYYPYLGRNTLARLSLPYGSTYLTLPGGVGDYSSCPDAAALDITADIDIRVDLSLLSWRAPQDLCGKYTSSGDQRSWVFQLNSRGAPCLTWSTDGTTTALHTAVADAAAPIPADHRQALRVTLDVNNGASGHTAAFYYSDTISGSWTQIGSSVVVAGTTSIFSSSAIVRVGDTDANTVPLVSGQPYDNFVTIDYESMDPPTGKAQAFQLLSGIAGTVVANPDFTVQAAADGSFADTSAAPNTWTMAGTSVLDDRDYRSHFEIPSWPQEWDLSGTDIYGTIEGAGILRRLGQGRPALKSPIRRELSSLHFFETSPLAYWPCEDGNGSTQIASGLPSGDPMVVTGSPDYEANTVFACSDSLPFLGNSKWSGQVTGGGKQVRFLYEADSGAVADGRVVLRVTTSSTPAYIDVIYNTAGNGTLKATAYDSDGTSLAATATVNLGSGINGRPARWAVSVQQSGGNVDVQLNGSEVGSDISYHAVAATAGTVGSVRTVTVDPASNIDQASVGHISVHTDFLDLLNSAGDFLDAFRGELAGRRIERILGEEGISFQQWGNLDNTPAMGSQHSQAILDLLKECYDTDGGTLYEPRDIFGIGYRTRESQYDQPAGLSLDYTASELFAVPRPTDDDRYTRNNITADNSSGGSAVATQSTGPLNTQQPEADINGVGDYPDTLTVNTQTDAPLIDMASWAVHLGTVDEERWQNVFVNLANPRIALDTALVADAQRLDVMEVVGLDNLPSNLPLPPNSTTQVVQQIVEELGNFEHTLSFNCSPASPWNIVEADASDYDRPNTSGSELAASLTSTATAATVYVSDGPPWITTATVPGDFPVSLKLAGEQVTATAITSGAVDAFNRTTANGWGTADVGGAWTVNGGLASAYSTSAGVASVAISAVNSSRYAVLASPSADTDQIVTVNTGALATGGGQYLGLVARWLDSSNSYTTRLTFTTTQTVLLGIRARVGAVETAVVADVTLPNMTHAAATDFTVRFQVAGSTLKAKAWLTSGREPDFWHCTGTDTSLTAAGSTGTRSLLDAANTNTLPFTVNYKNYEVSNPQAFTLTRSVNGVVKAQAAGEAIQLLHPVPIAL